MKKLFFASSLFLFLSTLTYSQVKGDLEIGLNLGLNLSNITDIVGYDVVTSTRASYNVGGSLEYYFNDNWGIKGSLIYDRKGWADDFFYFEDTDEEFLTDYALNYMTLPVYASFHFGRERNWYLGFGPYIGFLTSAKAVEPDFDVSEAINNTDFGLGFDIGYKFMINEKIKLFFEYDLQVGLSDIFKGNFERDIRNNRNSINAGLLFLLY